MKYFPGMKRSIVCFSEEVRRMRENGELPVLREEDLYPQPIDDEPFEPDDEMEEDERRYPYEEQRCNPQRCRRPL